MAKRMARVLMSSGLAMMANGLMPVQADTWNIAGQTRLAGGYDDNVRLSTVEPISAANGSADVSGQLLFQDDAFLWRLSPRLVALRYNGEQVLNRTEQYLSMLTQKTTERSNTSVAINVTQDTTLTSELGLTGLAEVNKKHQSWSATISNAWQFSELIKTDVQFYASANRYLDAELTGLVDYNYGSALLSGDYSLNERSQLSLQASVGKLQVPDMAAYDKTNLSLTIGYALQLTPRWQINASYGPSQAKSTQHSERGSVYDASVTHRSEISNLSLSVSRDVTPTGQGTLTRREQIRLGLNQGLSERWSTGWSLVAVRNRNLLPDGGLELSTVAYGDLTGNLSWRISPTWSLAASAGYTRQRVDTAVIARGRAAERRHAALSLSWNGLARDLN